MIVWSILYGSKGIIKTCSVLLWYLHWKAVANLLRNSDNDKPLNPLCVKFVFDLTNLWTLCVKFVFAWTNLWTLCVLSLYSDLANLWTLCVLSLTINSHIWLFVWISKFGNLDSRVLNDLSQSVYKLLACKLEFVLI